MSSEYNDTGDADDGDEDSFANIANIILYIGVVASIPFLLATFIVYTILPELSNIHGLTMRGYVGSLLVACITLLVFLSTVIHGMEMPCFLFEFIIYFSLTASYFWLNVMCFDIWWTFGGFRPLKKSKPKVERKKYIFYSIYVWGWAILLNTIWVVVVLVAQDGNISSCSMSNHRMYIFVPIGATLYGNMILFILTMRNMVSHNKVMAQRFGDTDSRRDDNNKQWFFLYLKLYILMGINWSLDMIGWISGEWKYIDFIQNMIAAYQGVIVFILFICKKKILRLVAKRCRCQRPNSLGCNSGSSACRSSIPRASATTANPDDVASSSRERF